VKQLPAHAATIHARRVSVLNTAFPLDIASRASNLSERISIVDALIPRNSPALPDAALSAFAVWKMNQLAGKLAGQFLKESLFRGTAQKYTKEDLIGILTAYMRIELNLENLTEHEKRLLADIHQAWLPTYQRALYTFDPALRTPAGAHWYTTEIYYGKCAKVCEPFLAHLHQELSPACREANAELGVNMFGSQVIEDLQQHLLHRFELALARALEVEIHVYCARQGIEKAQASKEDYIAYLDTTFPDAASYHRFYLRFPLLGRWLALITRLLSETGRALIARLCADLAEISAAFFGKTIVAIRSLKPGMSDPHAGGQSVICVEAELADAQRGTFLYKPRCLHPEVALQGLLERLARDNVLTFATYQILSRQNYGYAALIPPGRNHVQSHEEAGRIYEELGGYLALFHALGGSDMHFENLLIADGHAFICDGETALGVLPYGESRALDTVLDSVYKTGLLEWPRSLTADDGAKMHLSGYTGGESFHLPFAQPRVSNRLSFNLSVAHEVGIQIDPDAANRVSLAGHLVKPEDFKAWILSGFRKVYAWLQREPSATIGCVSALFADAPLRFINWSTQIYTQMLLSACHPHCLMEPLEVDLIFNTLMEHPRTWDRDGLMAECERVSLWRFDIPLFTIRAQEQALIHDAQVVLPLTFESTPLACASERIRHLSAEDCLQQVHYITASLSAGDVHSPSFIASALEYARRIGWQLCQLQRPASEDAPWTSYLVRSSGIRAIDIPTDLYNGSAGLALFLAYLDAIVPRQEFRQAAERALAYSIARQDRQTIGAFQGLGGVIYVLTHLYHLWKSPALLAQALTLSRELSSHIEEDEEFDILSGSAGVIPVMLGLAAAAPGEGIASAHRCARHLIEHATHEASGLSWPLKRPEEATAHLTGFSHGASGIGWALISVGAATNQPAYIAAGRQAFAYEALHFDEQERDWYDVRANSAAVNQNGLHFANAWCNGAAGIGLSRIASWAMLGKQDDDLLREAHIALATTLRHFHRLGNDTLCHGKAGNAELFLRFALLKGEPAFQLEANVQAQAQWRNFEKARNWIFGGIGVNVFPGLMIGLAGLGMHFLRLAYPDRIPSPLLLDAYRETSKESL
jgi:type 2 lantibiotic biosynthesis protein LanM